MRKMFAVLAVTGVILAGCAGPADGPGSTGSADPGERCDPELHTAFQAWERAGFSGAVAISIGGRFDCLAGYGYADEATGALNTVDTVFNIGSVTKAVTAAAVLNLEAEGRLSLTDRAGDLLPRLAGPVADATVRQLLLHTSGLHNTFSDDYVSLTADEAIAAISSLELAFPPGTGYGYANAGYTLLALIIEQVSGTSYRDYLTSRMLRLPGEAVAGGFWRGEPAASGPRAVGYLDNGHPSESGEFAGPHWALDGASGLAMSVSDLAAWTSALFTGQVVPAASVEALTTTHVELGEGRWEVPGWVAHDDYGVPLFITTGGEDGVGHRAAVAWLPEAERVVAVASNRPEVSAEELLTAVGPALLTGAPLPTPVAPAGHGDPGAIVGVYQLDTGGWFEVAVRDDRLRVSAGGPDAVAVLFPPDAGVADQLTEHAARVRSLLNDQSGQGREERAAIEAAFGAITEVAPAGTLVVDGELRTYVTLTTVTGSVTGWYALNEHGGVEAAEVPADPPAMPLVPAGGDRYRPDDPTAAGPEITVEFGDGRMTIIGASGAVVAHRVG